MPTSLISSQRPELLIEFRRVVGARCDVNRIRMGSARLAEWECPQCRRRWEEPVRLRVKRPPLCSDCRVDPIRPPAPQVGNALADKFPAIAREMTDCSKYPGCTPAEFRPFSNCHVEWTCATCHHRWSARIAERTAGGNGCPKCANLARGRANRRRRRGRSALEVAPHLAKEFVAWASPSCTKTLSDVGAGSALRATWKCQLCGNTWRSPVFLRTKGTGCRCSNRKRPRVSTPISQNPILAKRFVCNRSHPLKNEVTTSSKSSDICDWCCDECGHRWTSRATTVANSKRKCPSCAKLWSRCPSHGRSIADLFPHLVKEFVENLTRPHRTPETLLPDSLDRCVWQCSDCSRTWETTPSTRSKGKDCPTCKRVKGSLEHHARKTNHKLVQAVACATSCFIANLTHPQRNITELSLSSNDECLWSCMECRRRFRRSVGRYRQSQTCTDCSARNRGARWRKAGVGESLAERHPEIAATYVCNQTWPGDGPSTLRCKSRAICQWRCMCGAVYEAPVVTRTLNPAYGCGACRKRGISLLEIEVATLLQEATGDRVEFDVSVVSSRRTERVDLYIQAFDLYLDLDPHKWHSSTEAVRRDRRKSVAMKSTGLYYARVRPKVLPKVPSEIIPIRSDEKDARQWFVAICNWATTKGIPIRHLDLATTDLLLKKAGGEWIQLNKHPPAQSIATVYPAASEDFLENLSRPGTVKDWIPAVSGDECLWKCSLCGSQWTQTVASRFKTKNDLAGCKACRKKQRKGDAAMRQVSVPVREAAPSLIDEFVRFVDPDALSLTIVDAGGTLLDLSVGSGLRCLWRCKDCQHQWEAPVGARTTGKGCPKCALSKRASSRRKAKAGESLAETDPEIAKTFLANLENPDEGTTVIRRTSNVRCRWRCPCCDSTDWAAPVSSRCISQGCIRCRRTRTGRRRKPLQQARSRALRKS